MTIFRYHTSDFWRILVENCQVEMCSQSALGLVSALWIQQFRSNLLETKIFALVASHLCIYTNLVFNFVLNGFKFQMSGSPSKFEMWWPERVWNCALLFIPILYLLLPNVSPFITYSYQVFMCIVSINSKQLKLFLFISPRTQVGLQIHNN